MAMPAATRTDAAMMRPVRSGWLGLGGVGEEGDCREMTESDAQVLRAGWQSDQEEGVRYERASVRAQVGEQAMEM